MIIGPNPFLTAINGYQGDSDARQYVAFDDVSLTRVYTPTLTATANPDFICAGQSTTLTASSSTYTFASSSYTWMPGGATGSTTVVSPPVGTTVYTLTGTDICGLTATPTTVTVTVVANPTITASATPTLTCPGSTVTLSASGGFASNYTWTPTNQAGYSVVTTPTAPTVYTVTGRDINHCSNTATVAVNVFTTSVSASPSPTICIGNTSTLTAISNGTASVSYTWNPGGTVSPTLAVTPSVTTVYTVTGTSSTGCVTTRTTTVHVNTFASINVNPSVICAGWTATLSATGASNYTWTPGPIYGASVAVTPIVTTTYTVGGIIPGCGIGRDVVTVTVLTPATTTLNLLSSNPYPCLGSSTTLSASIAPASSYTYSWSGPLSASTQSVSYAPTNNAIVNLSVTNMCGAVVTASTCVDVVSTACCTSAETLQDITVSSAPWNSITSYTYNLVGTITIAANTTWTGDQFRMAGGSKIIVNPGIRLTLDNCRLFSCQDMWQGIVLSHNGSASGQLTMTNCTIEDAYRAVYNDCLNTTIGGNVSISGSTFNKNYIGVNIVNSLSTSGADSYHPMAVSQSTFNSQASTNSPGAYLKCSSYYSPTIRARGRSGIEANTVKGIEVGASSPGVTPNNYFSYTDYGIFYQESSLRCFYNKFSNLTGSNTITPPALTLGVGIYGLCASTANSNVLISTGCNFQEVYRAVENQKVSDTRLNTYTVTNSAISSLLCSSGCIGNTGFYAAEPSVYFQANVGTLTNCYTGINVNYSAAQSNTVTLSAGNNTITCTGSNVPNQAIVFQSSVNNFTTSTSVPLVVMAANNVSNYPNGLYVLNFKNSVRISNNAISIPYAASGARTGIRLNGTENATIDHNTISSTNTANTSLRGVYMQLAPGCKTQCNSVSTVGQGFVFEGNCLSTGAGWANNSITGCYDGLVLQTNGVFGKQGQDAGTFTSQRYSGNQWLGTFGHSKTFVPDHGSSALNSILVVQNNTNEYPQPQSLNITTGTGILNADNFGSSTYNTSPSIVFGPSVGYTCPSAMTAGLKAAQDTMGDALARAVQDTALYLLVNQPDSNGVLYEETLELNRQYVFGLMDRGYATSHAGLNSFYNSYRSSAFNTYSGIDSLVQSGNYNDAQSLNSGASTSTPISQNQQFINAMLLQHLQSPSAAYAQQDLDNLNVLANKCPLKDGNAVYQSRALLSMLANDNLAFADNCDSEEVLGKAGNMAKPSPAENFVLFPNPNNGSMTLSYHIYGRASLKLYDVNGRELYKYSLSPDNNTLSLSANLAPGIYYYSVTHDDGAVLKTDKLIIIK